MRGNASGRAEDYLRAVYEIIERKGCARTKDISKELNVKQPSVVEMMKKLHKRRFVVYERYCGVSLTPRGKDVAETVKKRRQTFEKVLELILALKDIASKDVHVLEHSLRPETVLQFMRFVDFIAHASAIGRPKFVGR